MRKLRFFILFSLLATTGFGQQVPGVFSGPMLGEVTPTSARIWLQTEAPAKVQLKVTSPQIFTLQIRTTEAGHRLASFELSNLQPDQRYTYELQIDTLAPQTFHFTTAPETGTATDVRFALGSCKLVTGNMYKDPRKSKRRKYRIYREIAKLQPELMFWLGDYVYMRADDHGDTARVYRRYSFNRALPSMQPLLHHTANLAILDDHDFGPDDADSSFKHKALNQQAFKDFWPNGQFGEATVTGTERLYQYADLDFFLTDNRSKRCNPQLPEELRDSTAGALKRKRLAKKNRHRRTDGQGMGPAQLKWLIDGLQRSTASFKFILMGSQFLNNAEKTFFGYNSNFYHVSKREYHAIINAIDSLQIQNVVILSGDRHFAEAFEYRTPKHDVRILELTYSGLSSPNIQLFSREKTDRRVEGSYFGKKNFGFVEVSGPAGQRELRVKTYNKRGKVKRWFRWVME